MLGELMRVGGREDGIIKEKSFRRVVLRAETMGLGMGTGGGLERPKRCRRPCMQVKGSQGRGRGSSPLHSTVMR